LEFIVFFINKFFEHLPDGVILSLSLYSPCSPPKIPETCSQFILKERVREREGEREGAGRERERVRERKSIL
jgi:hypothetical protein